MSLVFLFPLLLTAEELNLPEDFEPDPKRPHAPLSFSATRNYWNEKSAIQARYRSRLADALAHADGAEIMLLDPSPVTTIPEGREEDYFPITPDQSYSKIVRRKVLQGDSVATCRKATGELLRDEDHAGALCHHPIHAIRLFRGKEVIFKTSICWKCSNYYLEYPDDYKTASWVGLSAASLKEFLMAELPVPPDTADEESGKKLPTGETGSAKPGK